MIQLCITESLYILYAIYITLLYTGNIHQLDFCKKLRCKKFGNSLVVQLLGLHAFAAKGLGSLPSHGTRSPQTVWRGQKKKMKCTV